ncbi:protein sneaky-like [Tigriopus californicus]|uniref:protein sneaky-like n=1 Tax=Tigriopus californicus TaxID=6832 RepID=UPI0027DA273F|nr:protein sneaky-like [Tigriopus californicus]
MFIYYYVTFLILDPIIPPEQGNNSTDSIVNGPETKIDPCKPSSFPSGRLRMDADNETMAYRDHALGGMVGLGVTGSLGLASIFSTHIRSSMMLIIPGLFAARGRSLMLTAAMGILIDGPINNINYNVEQIIGSVTCMYEQMKTMACRYDIQFRNVFDQVAGILEDIHEIVQEQRQQIAEMASHLSQDLQAEVRAHQRRVQKKMENLKGKLGTLQGVINAPGNLLNGVCSGVNSALAGTGRFFQDVGKGLGDTVKKIWNFFGRRRKRDSGCGIPSVIPSIGDINVPEVNLDALKKWAKELFPDLNVLDLNLSEFEGTIDSTSILELRGKIIGILRDVFEMVQSWTKHTKKIFYLVSLILVVLDAFQYLKNYWSDDSFDNLYVDNNLRRLWRDHGKEKLTPLRHWELNEKFQMSASVKISKREATRILTQSIPTMVFTAIVIAVLVTDFALANLLGVLLEHGDYAISFAGMEQGLNLGDLFGQVNSGEVSLASLKLEGFDMSSEPCLPRATHTSYSSLSILALIIVVSGCSCIFDAYACRWRAVICNFYYSTRAKERGEYLYKRIKAGRGNRRFQMTLVVKRELKRRELLRTFASWANIPIIAMLNLRAWRCPSCMWKAPKSDCVSVVIGNEKTWICSDCYKDY